MLQASSVFSAEVSPKDKKAYLKAMLDAQVTEQREVCRNLVAVVPWPDAANKKTLKGGEIQWEGDKGHSRVLVAAFMSQSTYDAFYKPYMKDSAFTLTKSLWVTVIPELKNRFSDLPAECPPSKPRVLKLLGLNPARNYDVLVEMWVNPKDLFRPSADPEITDHESQMAAIVKYRGKEDPKRWTFPSDLNPFMGLSSSRLFVDEQGLAPVTFKEWYINNYNTTYKTDSPDVYDWGMPWTRLGYTYDWGNTRNHVGLSEFIIRIDPDQNGGEVIVKLHKAIDTPGRWSSYFVCGEK
jgi:hypothetical protein